MMSLPVVVCDDEFHITRAISLKLDRAGYDVHATNNAEIAWDLIERTQPALVVVEDHMSGLSGWELIERLRTTPDFFDLPCILLTQQSLTAAEVQTASELRIDAVVPKPFSLRQLVAQCHLAAPVDAVPV